MLAYDKGIRVCIEPKPNEPIDRSICGTMGHVMAVSAATIDPKRVGGNLESAHAILAGLDPANEIGFALAFGKLFTVHLNDQNGIRYDQDKSFGVENLRAAFNQVKVLVENDYGSHGEYVGLDVKAMRTTSDEDSYEHLKNSLNVFKALEEKVARWDYEYTGKLIAERKFEQLEMYTHEPAHGHRQVTMFFEGLLPREEAPLFQGGSFMRKKGIAVAGNMIVDMLYPIDGFPNPAN